MLGDEWFERDNTTYLTSRVLLLHRQSEVGYQVFSQSVNFFDACSTFW